MSGAEHPAYTQRYAEGARRVLSIPEECARRRADIPVQPLLNMCRIRSFAIDIGTATLNVFLIRALYLIADDRIGMQKTIPHLFEQEPSALWIG